MQNKGNIFNGLENLKNFMIAINKKNYGISNELMKYVFEMLEI